MAIRWALPISSTRVLSLTKMEDIESPKMRSRAALYDTRATGVTIVHDHGAQAANSKIIT